MKLSYQSYKDSDLGLLQNCIVHWHQQYPDGTYAHAGDIPHRLYNGNRGRFSLADITRIYYLGDEVAAMLLCYPRHSSMNIFINPNFYEQTDLFVPVIEAGYEIVRQYMLDNDKQDDPVVVDCHQSDQYLPIILSQAGFKEGANPINLTRRKLENIPKPNLPEGFTIRAATIDDAEQLANVHDKSFGSGWTAELYRNEVMLKPGYSPEHEFVVIAPDGTFAAFTETWLDIVNKIGLFEPVGTHEDFRRIGLARAMMSHVMQIMCEDGMVEAEVCYGTDNPASEGLYKGLGFEVRHHIYDWERNAGDKA